MEENKYPFAFIDNKGKDAFAFIYNNEILIRTIPEQGMARYLYNNKKYDELEYMLTQAIKERKEMNEVNQSLYKDNYKDKFSSINEKSTITNSKVDMIYMDEENNTKNIHNKNTTIYPSLTTYDDIQEMQNKSIKKIAWKDRYKGI